MDSLNRFNETSLLPKDAFYSTLTREHIGDEDYAHAQAVWKELKNKNMGEYHDLYLLTDTLLLADVFEGYRRIGFQKYGLDPAHNFTTPGFAWDALLKMTKIQLELLTDYGMHLFIEKGTRGGISTVGEKRYAKANNMYMDKKSFDPDLEFSYIIYLDANNQYGWAMSQPPPTGNFKWLEKMPTEKQIVSWKKDRKVGAILEVDLEYPEELHDLHNGYPLAPERTKVPATWHSEYQQKHAKELNIANDDTEKLLLTSNNKKNYVVHYRNLQLYLRLGMKITKVHRVLIFTQETWMEKYIRFNTEERKKANSKFEEDFFKLMNNSVFGKTMENLRNRVTVELVRGDDVKKLRKLASDPLLADWRPFGENLFGIHMHKNHILFNRPIYVGMCVLQLPKTLLYDFY